MIQCVTICTVDNILCMYDFMLWLHFYFMPCFYMCIPCFYHVCILWKMLCQKWRNRQATTKNITIIGAPLVVARHRAFFFVDYQDENGHSIVNLSSMWLLKSLNIISTQNHSHLEPVEKRSKFMKSVGYMDFDDLFVEVGVIQIRSFSKQMECDMIYQLSLTRSFFQTNFHSNINTI